MREAQEVAKVIDWTQDGTPGFDEKVVIEAEPLAFISWFTFPNKGRRYGVLVEIRSSRAYPILSAHEYETPAAAFTAARQHPTVQAWEREHNPKYAKTACPLCLSAQEHQVRRPHETALCMHCGRGIWRITDNCPTRWRHLESMEACAPSPTTYAEPRKATSTPVVAGDGFEDAWRNASKRLRARGFGGIARIEIKAVGLEIYEAALAHASKQTGGGK